MMKYCPDVGAPLPGHLLDSVHSSVTLSSVSREVQGVRSGDDQERHAAHPQVLAPTPSYGQWTCAPMGLWGARGPNLAWGFSRGACPLSLAVLAHPFPELLVCQTLGRTHLVREASCELTNTPFFFLPKKLSQLC